MNASVQAVEIGALEAQLAQERDATRRVALLNALAWELRRLDERRTLALSEEALRLAVQGGDARGEAHGLLGQGYALVRLSDFKAALACLLRARPLFEQLGDKDGLRRTLNVLGMLHGDSGNLLGALGIFLETRRLCAELNDRRGEANSLNNTGLVYGMIGDHANALEYHLRALRLFRELDFRGGEVMSLTNLGLAAHELGRYPEALEYFLRSISIEGAPSDAYQRRLGLLYAGRTYFQLGEHRLALEHLLESLAMMGRGGDLAGEGSVRAELGLVYQRLGQVEEARACFERSLALREQVGNLKGQAESRLYFGEFLTRVGRADQALAMLHKARTAAAQIGAKVELYKAHGALAAAYQLNGQFREAFSHLEQFIAVKESVFNDASDLRLHSLKVQFDLEQVERAHEIERLRNVELAHVNARLHEAARELRAAHAQTSALLAQVERQAREDPLTGLSNRRCFDGQLVEAFARAHAEGGALSVVLCDIDSFKQVNDRFSHQIGDEVLRTVAGLLRQNVRDLDVVARYGGEEFVMLFPELSAAAAVTTCERVRRAVERHDWQALHPGLRVTLSFGVSDDVNVAGAERMLGVADRRLYAAKRGGRNQVCADG